MQLTHNTITIFTTKNYREKHNIINCEEWNGILAQ